MNNSNFYFRAKLANANIYRVSSNDRRSREMLTHIGTFIYQSKKIKLNDGESLNEAEEAEILAWYDTHLERLNRLERHNAESLIIQMNNTAQWIQSQATGEEITPIFEELLLAMFDLRQTLVRRFAKTIESDFKE